MKIIKHEDFNACWTPLNKRLLFSKTEITLKSLIILILLKVNRKDKSVISKLEVKDNNSGNEMKNY